jgi:hypothetical protein
MFGIIMLLPVLGGSHFSGEPAVLDSLMMLLEPDMFFKYIYLG